MTIVVGYIQTDEGRAALRSAVDEAILRGARLVVVESRHVDAPTNMSEVQGFEDKRAEVLRDLEAAVGPFRARLDEAGLDHELRVVVPSSDPSTDLTSIAAELEAGLLVIGMRRRSAVGKLLLGSHAQRILLESPCPVLSVYARQPA